MKITLKFQLPDGQHREAELQTGEELTIGRTSRARLVIPDDPYLSSLHLSLICLEDDCRLLDRGSASGTFVNDQRVEGAILKPGDIVRAGGTRIEIAWDKSPPPPPPTIEITSEEEKEYPESVLRLLTQLRRRTTLYAVLDGARDPMIHPMLTGLHEQFECLYHGKSAETLAAQAPYLVKPDPAGSLLRFLARFSWGKSWGVYLIADCPMTDLRKHPRKFLMVEDPNGKEVYFRYYDPRVMRVFLPTCRPEELREFFGPVRAWLVESAEGRTLLEFRADVTAKAAETYEIQPAGSPHV